MAINKYWRLIPSSLNNLGVTENNTTVVTTAQQYEKTSTKKIQREQNIIVRMRSNLCIMIVV